jgi:hypothetical protein
MIDRPVRPDGFSVVFNHEGHCKQALDASNVIKTRMAKTGLPIRVSSSLISK